MIEQSRRGRCSKSPTSYLPHPSISCHDKDTIAAPAGWPMGHARGPKPRAAPIRPSQVHSVNNAIGMTGATFGAGDRSQC